MMDSADFNKNLIQFLQLLKREKSLVKSLGQSSDIIRRAQTDLDQEDAVEELRDLILE